MEYVLAAVAVASVVLNLILVYRVTRVPLIEYPLCVLEAETTKDSGEVPVMIEDRRTDSVTKEQSSFQAWTNKKNIPWCELDRPKPEPVRSQRSGPLERPPGFV